MSDKSPGTSIEFLGRSFSCDEVALEPAGEKGADLVVSSSEGLVLRCRRVELQALENAGGEYALAGDESDPLGQISLDGFDYPIVEARFRLDVGREPSLLELAGTAESIEYDGCDEVVRLVSFRGRLRLPGVATGDS